MATKGKWLPRSQFEPGDYDALERIRGIVDHLRSGKPSCEVIDELGELADLASTHPNPAVSEVARRLQATISRGKGK